MRLSAIKHIDIISAKNIKRAFGCEYNKYMDALTVTLEKDGYNYSISYLIPSYLRYSGPHCINHSSGCFAKAPSSRFWLSNLGMQFLRGTQDSFFSPGVAFRGATPQHICLIKLENASYLFACIRYLASGGQSKYSFWSQ